MPYWNANTWDSDVTEWQEAVIRNTDPINVDGAISVIQELYHDMNYRPPNPANWFVASNPLEAAAMYFYLLGHGELNGPLRNFWNRHSSQFRKLEKLPKNELISLVPHLTVANLGRAWADGVVDENVVKVPHDGGGRSIFEDLAFNGPGLDDPDESSMESRAMDFVVDMMVATVDILANGAYEAGPNNELQQVDGYGGIPAKVQQELYMDWGFWQFIGQNFWHIYKNNYDNPWVNRFIRLYTAAGPWIGTKSYVILVDRPEVIRVAGLDGRRHSTDGPAIKWNGFDQYYVQNMPVPKSWIEDGINPNDITAVRSPEWRRIMLDITGMEAWLESQNATLLDEGEYNGRPYQLYQTRSPGNEVLHLLSMQDATPKWDDATGQLIHQRYVLPVSSNATTILEALADMASTTPEQYKLVRET